MKKISIKSNFNDYYVLFDECKSYIEEDIDNNFFIIDSNIFKLYFHFFKKIPENKKYIIDAIEENKTILESHNIIEFLIHNNFKKNSKLIAVGGGIVQDLTCFIASILFRGVKWKFYPTTLLSQCDSCIGSKSSININKIKNQVGTFYPPESVIIDTKFLDTLDKSELYSGIGEIIKVCFLDPENRNKKLFKDYDSFLLNKDVLEESIFTSLSIKKDIIEIDEFDKNYRNIMNYGHTFGHAIELVSNFKIPHGIAVTIGMIFANNLSFKLNMIDKISKDKMNSLLYKNIKNYNFTIKGKEELFWEALLKDKKNVGNKVSFILTEGFGKMKKVNLELNKDIKKYIIESY